MYATAEHTRSTCTLLIKFWNFKIYTLDSKVKNSRTVGQRVLKIFQQNGFSIAMETKKFLNEIDFARFLFDQIGHWKDH